MTTHETWYIAELLMEIRVSGDARNVVHRNHIILTATSNEQAYQKAMEFGRKGETAYLNPQGAEVTITFRGVADLDEILEPLEDGAEVLYHYRVDVQESEILSLLPPKVNLRIFAPRKAALGPDYASGEIVRLAERRMSPK